MSVCNAFTDLPLKSRSASPIPPSVNLYLHLRCRKTGINLPHKDGALSHKLFHSIRSAIKPRTLLLSLNAASYRLP